VRGCQAYKERERPVELVRQKTYRKTFEIACTQLAESDLPDRLMRAGVRFRVESGAYLIDVAVFDETIQLAIPGFSFASDKGSSTTLTTKIVLLHYLIHASGNAVLGVDPIPYEDIPGCRTYSPVFERRVSKPLLSAFGYARDAFLDAGIALGGKAEEYGDASFTVLALPRVPITFILWEGDQDFPPSMKILFDRSIHSYLPLEDIVVVSKMAATRLLKQARKGYVEG